MVVISARSNSSTRNSPASPPGGEAVRGESADHDDIGAKRNRLDDVGAPSDAAVQRNGNVGADGGTDLG